MTEAAPTTHAMQTERHLFQAMLLVNRSDWVAKARDELVHALGSDNPAVAEKAAELIVEIARQ